MHAGGREGDKKYAVNSRSCFTPRDDATAYIFVMCELVFTVVDRGGRAILRVTPTLCFNLQRDK